MRTRLLVALAFCLLLGGAPPGQPPVLEQEDWAATACARLVDAATLEKEVQRHHAILVASGYREDFSNEQFFDWLDEASDAKARYRLLREYQAKQIEFSRVLRQLWWATCFAEPVVRFAENGRGIDDMADAIASYEAFLDEHGNASLEDVVTRGLEKTIDALRTEEWHTAIAVVQRRVKFETEMITSRNHLTLLRKPLGKRERLHKSFAAWYGAAEPELRWDARTRRFWSAEGAPFDYPPFEERGDAT